MFRRKPQQLPLILTLILLGFCATWLLATRLSLLSLPPTANSITHTQQPQPVATQPTQRFRYAENFSTTHTKQLIHNLDWNVAQRTLLLARRDQIQQQESVIASTPTNDAIYVVWRDLRNDDGDIYAQCLDARGNRLWPADLRINRDLGVATQFEPAAAVDPAGNLWVAWVDNRQGNNDIYAQRISTAGVHLWGDDKQVNRDINNADQGGVAITLLPEQGAVLAWHDNRGESYDIYGERLNNDGVPLWTENLRLNRDVSASAQTYPTLAATTTGSLLVAWLDQRVGNSDLYAQHITANGEARWTTDLRLNQPAEAAQSHPRLACNAANACWLSWRTAQEGRLLAQQVSVDGQPPQAPALSLSQPNQTADPNQQPALTATADGTFVAAWVASSDSQLYAQRFSPQGGLLWPQAMALGRSTPQPRLLRSSVALTPARQHFVIATWSEQLPTYPGEIYTQALDQTGSQQWSPAALVNEPSGRVDQQLVAVATAANGETVLAWQDWRSGSPALWGQRLTATGEHSWPEHRPLSVISTTVGQLAPALTIVGNDGVVVWSDSRSGAARLYAQRFDPRGNRRWATDRPIAHPSDPTTAQLNPTLTSDPQGRTYVAWTEVGTTQQRLLLQQLDNQGATIWNQPLTTPSGATPLLPDLAAGPANDLYLAWLEKSADGANVFVQRASAEGSLLWPQMVQANRATDEVNTLNPPAVGVDAAGNAVVVWVDRQDALVMAQRLNASGQPQWPTDVAVNSHSTAFAPLPDLAVTPAGDALVVWQHLFEKRYTLAAQRLAGDGARLWSEVLVSRQASAAQRPKISLDATGNAVISWQERRFNNWDIAAQRLAPTGELIWPYDHLLLPQEHFYFGEGVVESTTVDETSAPIAAALVNVTYVRNGGALALWLSNDGGAHWEAVQPGLLHTFANAGSDLRWKLALSGDPHNLTRTPSVTGLTLDYLLTVPAPDPYEADEECSAAWPLQLNGLAPRRQMIAGLPLGDVDWFHLTMPQTGRVTLIAQSNPPTATLGLTVSAACDGPALDFAATQPDGLARLTISATAQSQLFVKLRPEGDELPLVTYTLAAHQGQSGQRAVLVAGVPVTNSLVIEQIQRVADRAYRTLRRHGYAATNIYFLNSAPVRDADGDGNNDVDAPLSAVGLQAALEEWPRTLTDEPTTALALFVVGVGQAGALQTAANEQVTAEQLDLWLENAALQTGANPLALVLDLNQAGRWIAPVERASGPTLAQRSRIILAATDQTGVVWQTPTGLLFSDLLWTLLDQGASLRESSQQTQALIAQIGYRCTGVALPCQQPGLDDNGDGWANTAVDGDLAQSWRLPPAPRSLTPLIQGVTLQPQTEAEHYLLEATVLHSARPTAVLAEIRPLTATVALPSDGLPVAANFPILPLQPVDALPVDDAFATAVRYRALLTGLTVPAEYRLVLFAQTDGELAALPKIIHLRTGVTLYLPVVTKSR